MVISVNVCDFPVKFQADVELKKLLNTSKSLSHSKRDYWDFVCDKKNSKRWHKW